MKALNISPFLYCLFSGFSLLVAQSSSHPSAGLSPDLQVVFGPQTPVELVITLDMKEVFRKKEAEEYQPATLVFDPHQLAAIRNIEVKTRGVFRNDYCAIPPLKLKLKKIDLGYPAWDTLGSVKLVTTCKSAASFSDLLIKEYIAYQLYETLTPRSFQTRLVSITFRDSKERFPDVEQMGFLIEEIEDVAARNDAFEVEPERMAASWADRHQTLQMTLFQYAIGNTDWQITNLHNFKVLKPSDVQRTSAYLIPYDFDFSGLVNAPYATPDPALMVPNVRTRVFLGRCYSEAEIALCIDEFLQVKDQWIDIATNNPHLSPQAKKETLTYLNEFFQTVEDERLTDVAFFPNCFTTSN